MADHNCQGHCEELKELQRKFEKFEEESRQDSRELLIKVKDLEKKNEVQDTKYDEIIRKLDELTKQVKALEEKPAKRWDSLVGYVLSAAAGAFLLWITSGFIGG